MAAESLHMHFRGLGTNIESRTPLKTLPQTTRGQSALWTPTGLFLPRSGSHTAVEEAAKTLHIEERSEGGHTQEGTLVKLLTERVCG